MRLRIVALVACVLSAVTLAWDSGTRPVVSGPRALPGPMDILYAAPGNANYSYGPKGADLDSLRANLTAAATSTFTVTYDAAFNANAPAKAAFQAAVDLWSNIMAMSRQTATDGI